MKHLIRILPLLMGLSADAGTLTRELPTTSAFTKRLLTNETAEAWDAQLGNGLTNALASIVAGSNNLNGNFSGGITSTGTTAQITVSPRGKANVKSLIPNDGAQFGPDTPGTTTSGIQEALNAVPVKIGWGTNTTGATIKFGRGDYYFFDPIVYSNTFVYSIKWEGEGGLLGSRLIYAGAQSNISTITFASGGNPISSPQVSMNIQGHVELHDLTFTSVGNQPLILVRITNYSQAVIEDCNFTGWEVTTNNWDGPGVSITTYPVDPPGNVGLVIGNVNEHATWVNRCFFANLATGIHLLCDHAYCDYLKFAEIGEYGFGTGGTAWPSTSPYSLGACILRWPGLDTRLKTPHFYIAKTGLAMDNPGNNTLDVGSVNLDNPQFEAADRPIAASSMAQRIFISGGDQPGGDLSAVYQIRHAPYSLVQTQMASLPNLHLALYNHGSTNVTRLLGTTASFGNVSDNLVGDVPLNSGLMFTNGTLSINAATLDTNHIFLSGAGTTAANGTYTFKSGAATYAAWTNNNGLGCGVLLDVSLGVNVLDAYEVTNASGHLYGTDASRTSVAEATFYQIGIGVNDDVNSTDHVPPTSWRFGTNVTAGLPWVASAPYISPAGLLMTNQTLPTIPTWLPKGSTWFWCSNGDIYGIKTDVAGARSTNKFW